MVSLLQVNEELRSRPAPFAVGKYTLSAEFHQKHDSQKEFATGLYEYRRQKVFIKTWFGKAKDIRYYALINESAWNDILYRKFTSLRPGVLNYRVSVPKMLGVVESKGTLSVISEYIEGTNASTRRLDEQEDILYATLRAFESISDMFSRAEMERLFQVSTTMYVITLPLLTVLALASRPRDVTVIAKAFTDTVKQRTSIMSKKLYVSHRDLEPQNLIVRDRTIYVVDCERTARTVANYDLNHLSLKPMYKRLATTLYRRLHVNKNEFLKNYIALQFVSTPDQPPYFNNFYLEYLQKKYSRKIQKRKNILPAFLKELRRRCWSGIDLWEASR